MARKRIDLLLFRSFLRAFVSIPMMTPLQYEMTMPDVKKEPDVTSRTSLLEQLTEHLII